MTRRRRRYEQAVALRALGLTTEEIADTLGLSERYIADVLRDPAGERQRRRYLDRLTPLRRKLYVPKETRAWRT